jgi:hypothetical protein
MRLSLAYVAVVFALAPSAACDQKMTSLLPPPPTPVPETLAVTAFSPKMGWTTAPTIVNIYGTGFLPGSRVLVDQVALDTTFVSSTALFFTVPAHEPAVVELAVVTPSGETVKALERFSFVLPPLRVFTDAATGFSTTDIRDANDRIVQFNQAGQLIWTDDGTYVSGYFPDISGLIPAHAVCDCWFEIRFGAANGERRGYLTAEYGHDNPGTILDLSVVAGVVTVRQSTVYPPGTATLSGVVTEAIPTGTMPVEGAIVYVLVGGGWRSQETDGSGRYAIPGLYDSNPHVEVWKTGYSTLTRVVTVSGDTRVDFEIVHH